MMSKPPQVHQQGSAYWQQRTWCHECTTRRPIGTISMSEPAASGPHKLPIPRIKSRPVSRTPCSLNAAVKASHSRSTAARQDTMHAAPSPVAHAIRRASHSFGRNGTNRSVRNARRSAVRSSSCMSHASASPVCGNSSSRL
eukprot:scaffold240389_cov28-Tisochrysis_lutea.AAC.3